MFDKLGAVGAIVSVVASPCCFPLFVTIGGVLGLGTTLWQAAALGLMERVQELLESGVSAPLHEVTTAFWCACHGGQRRSAEYLLGRGADINRVGHDGLTPIDAASRSGAEELVEWLRSQGAKSAKDL